MIHSLARIGAAARSGPADAGKHAAAGIRRVASSAVLRHAGTIALVGNGRIARSDAAGIDDHDCVIRINRAQLCGSAGRRTDILAVLGIESLREVTDRGRPINMRALQDAREIWSLGEVPAEDGLVSAFCAGRPILSIAPETRSEARAALLAHARTPRVKPTTGAVLLTYLLKTSTARITLFGFTHQGSKVHDWDAERAWMDALAQTPRVARADSGGPAVRMPAPERIAVQVRRLLNHIAAGRF